MVPRSDYPKKSFILWLPVLAHLGAIWVLERQQEGAEVCWCWWLHFLTKRSKKNQTWSPRNIKIWSIITPLVQPPQTPLQPNVGDIFFRHLKCDKNLHITSRYQNQYILALSCTMWGSLCRGGPWLVVFCWGAFLKNSLLPSLLSLSPSLHPSPLSYWIIHFPSLRGPLASHLSMCWRRLVF